MKRFKLILILLALLTGGVVYGALTYDESYYMLHLSDGGKLNPIYLHMAEVADLLEGTTTSDGLLSDSLQLTVSDDIQAHTKGLMWYSDANEAMEYWNGTSLISLGAGTGDNTLNAAYDEGGAGAGKAIDADSGAVAITVSDGDNNVALAIVQNDATNDDTAMTIASAADAANAISLDIDSQSTGRDIEGTGATWHVTGAGVITGTDVQSATGTYSGVLTTSVGITMDSAGTFTNATDTEFKFLDGGEDLIFDMDAASNVVGLKSSTGVTGLAMGAVDDLSGVGSIAMDVAAASIGTATTGAAEDLTVGITGATDSSLILASSGTNVDAIKMATSAGGIDITVAGAAGSEDLDLLSNTSISLTSTEAVQTAVIVASTGGFDVDTSATYDIALTAAGGKVLAVGNENAAGAVSLLTSGGGGTSETIVIANDQGSGEDSINIDSTAGGIDIDFATGKNMAVTGGQFNFLSNENVASAFSVQTNTGVTETIVITNSQGTGANAIVLLATAGGIDMDAAAALDVSIAGGQVALVSKDDASSAISLTANVGTSETIVVTNTQGTGAGAITLASTAGGVDIDAAAALDAAIAGGQVVIVSKDDAAGAISLTSNVGTSETITVTNTQGNTAGAIALTATAGGVTLSSSTGLTTGDPIIGDGTAAWYGALKAIVNDAEPHAVTAAESGKVLTNLGANGADDWTLPTAVAGYEYTFVVMAAQAMQIKPAAGDLINHAGTAMDAEEHYTANAVGETLHIIAVDATNWVVISETGTWVEATP